MICTLDEGYNCEKRTDVGLISAIDNLQKKPLSHTTTHSSALQKCAKNINKKVTHIVNPYGEKLPIEKFS
jgi:hypothetical protein